jgi:Ca-activated chloride channel family protein
MRRALSLLGLLALASCNHDINARFHADVGVDVTVSSSGTYAAMDEIPVSGGELRLVTPISTVDDTGDRVDAIAFPLRHTDVRADVAGMTAIYTVEQTFENPYDQPIEAVYVFPLGDEAAVSSYRITIGERTIEGEIQTREQAQATYDDAKAEGHTAALLEEDKANVFEQHLANIAPRETIKVRFQYVELLDYADGQYTIAFPLVVGPRYLPADRAAQGAHPVGSRMAGTPAPDGQVSIPYIDATLADSTVSFTANIDAGVPVLAVDSPSHDLDVEETTATQRTITLARADEIPNRDLVVRYRTAGDKTMVGVLTDRRGDDGYFLLLVQPKAEYRTGDIAPREIVILIDTSGSMEGVPLGQAKDVARTIIGTLSDRDTFQVIGFADGVAVMSDQPVPGTEAGKRQGTEFVASLESGGGTEMEGGLAESLETPPGHDRIRMVYLLSDGFVGNDDIILQAARGKLGHNRIFPVGIGSSTNRSLMDGLAEVGRGFASYLLPTERADDVTPDLIRRSAYPYMTDISVDWKGLKVTDVTPAAIPDVYAGQPLLLVGRYTTPGTATVEVSARSAGRRVTIPIDVTLPTHADLEPIASLWARQRIDALLAIGGEMPSDTTVQSVTQLGLAFHLVTEYTSFVAVDRTRVVVGGGKTRVVEQPAASPEGVNLSAAVGEDGSSYAPSYSSGGSSGYSGGGGSHWGGGDSGGYGGGDADPLTILLALALLPLAWTLRRVRAA